MRLIIGIAVAATLLTVSTAAFARPRGNSVASAKWLDRSLRTAHHSEHLVTTPRGWLQARANAGDAVKNDLPKWIREPQQITLKHEYYKTRDDFRELPRYQFVGADGAPLAVPEPGSIISLTAPLLGTMLYYRKRRK